MFWADDIRQTGGNNKQGIMGQVICQNYIIRYQGIPYEIQFLDKLDVFTMFHFVYSGMCSKFITYWGFR